MTTHTSRNHTGTPTPAHLVGTSCELHPIWPGVPSGLPGIPAPDIEKGYDEMGGASRNASVFYDFLLGTSVTP